MNKAKRKSKIDGSQFLKHAFSAEQRILEVEIALSTASITHSGVMGEVNEQHFISFLRRYLPRRYDINSAIVIDCNGRTSDQIDIVIYDNQYTPTLLDQRSHRFVPAEAVYAILEVKPTINKEYIQYAASKALSVRRLERTSMPILQIDGSSRVKKILPIVAGIVAPSITWRSGFSSKSFTSVISELTGDRHLDCGLSLSGGMFDSFGNEMKVFPAENALINFTFRLIKQLQAMGTAPAVDWDHYAASLSKSRN